MKNLTAYPCGIRRYKEFRHWMTFHNCDAIASGGDNVIVDLLLDSIQEFRLAEVQSLGVLSVLPSMVKGLGFMVTSQPKTKA
jgi:hypothetical protein